jgi:hypothetical protein
MKYNGRMLSILKNFASINPSLLFEQGNVLRTISVGKTVMAQAYLDQEIDRTFAIYDLSQLLSTLALFDSPEITTNDSYLDIVESAGNVRQNVKYMFAEPSLIVTPPKKEIVLPSVDVSFYLPADILSKTIKAASVMGAPEIAIVGNGTDVCIQTYNAKDVNTSNFKSVVGKTDKNFTMVFLIENLKLLPGDYQVNVSAKKISYFKGDNIEYWIAVEASSTF